MVQSNTVTCPEMISGLGSVEAVPDVVEDGQWSRALLVCGRRSFQESGADRIVAPLERVSAVERWSEFEPNPSAGDVLEGLRVLRQTDPDVVIGIGGGSALDLAKLLCGFDRTADTNDSQGLEKAISSGRGLQDRHRALILVPTTSGTGSEATHFSTVYVGQEKFSVAGEGLRPDVVILDPELSMSASPYQKATSGIDAVAQAIESLWATGATPASRRFARRALRYLLPNIEAFVGDTSPGNAQAMSFGSHLAGRAIDISRTTAAHALAYAITQDYGVSHGHAVGLTLGSFLEAHADPQGSKLQPGVDPSRHGQVMEDILSRFGSATGSKARRRFRELMTRLELPVDLSSVGIVTPEQRAEVAASVNPERLGNNPMVFDEDDLRALLADIG